MAGSSAKEGLPPSGARSFPSALTARLGGRTDAITAARKEIDAQAARAGQASWQLEQKQVTAPQGGLIQDTLFREGEFVPAGRPVVSLLPPENLKVRFFVPQAMLPAIQPDQEVQVQIDGMPERFTARVSYISPEAEFTPPVIYSKESRTKLVFLIEAVPAQSALDHLRPGQPLEVHLN